MQTTTYYRTAKGSHVHADFECANQRRAISSGTPVEVAYGELPPCEHCCTPDQVSEAAHKAQAIADAMCTNPGVTHPQRVRSACRSCGKVGTVDRRNGRLRAHKPANA